jgi:hypothetical protein
VKTKNLGLFPQKLQYSLVPLPMSYRGHPSSRADIPANNLNPGFLNVAIFAMITAQYSKVF